MTPIVCLFPLSPLIVEKICLFDSDDVMRGFICVCVCTSVLDVFTGISVAACVYLLVCASVCVREEAFISEREHNKHEHM